MVRILNVANTRGRRSAPAAYEYVRKAKTRRSGFFLTFFEFPSIAVLAMVDLPDPERVLRFRVGVD